MVENRQLLEALNNIDELLLPLWWKSELHKSVAESTKARKEGNALYVAGDHDEKKHAEILRFYTRSVAFAPPKSEALGLAYGNRSAILAHLRKYKESIEDVDRAIQLPLEDTMVVKYLCRKVECQVALGLEEAKSTCEVTKIILQEMEISDEIKKNVIIKLVKAIVKLEKRLYDLPGTKQKLELPTKELQSSECVNASTALLISHNGKNIRQGRHLTASRDILPGEILYVSESYVSMPMESKLYSHCSHCLRYTWAALPCPDCVYAVYCSKECQNMAQLLYHDIECKIIGKAWKVYNEMNSGRLMSVRMLILAIREAGGLRELEEITEEIDNCKESRKKGFSNNETMFVNNYKSAYSLVTHKRKRPFEQSQEISRDSAVLLYLLAKHTKLFTKYFNSDKNDLVKSEDALFVGKLLSHYQYVILINAISIKDAYISSTTDWSWSFPKEENCTGLYLIPFLSLLNHSCSPNVAKCETEDRKTILYSNQPIAKGEQIFDCYGATYCEMITVRRQKLLKTFYFNCECIACTNNWPLFMNMINDEVKYTTSSLSEIDASIKAVDASNKILETLKDGTLNCNINTIKDLSYAITLTVKYCQYPNWRLPYLISILTAVFNEIYGYVVNIPTEC